MTGILRICLRWVAGSIAGFTVAMGYDIGICEFGDDGGLARKEGMGRESGDGELEKAGPAYWCLGVG